MRQTIVKEKRRDGNCIRGDRAEGGQDGRDRGIFQSGNQKRQKENNVEIEEKRLHEINVKEDILG